MDGDRAKEPRRMNSSTMSAGKPLLAYADREGDPNSERRRTEDRRSFQVLLPEIERELGNCRRLEDPRYVRPPVG